VAQRLAGAGWGRNLFSFVEQGGWYSADAFVNWMTQKLNEGEVDGKPRAYGALTLAQFHKATGMEVTLVASDCTAMRILFLNHRTAPDLPIVWAARRSMSIPLLWQEVIWREAWGTYQGEEMTRSVIVDGGRLSNFPIALFLSTRPEIGDVVGEPRTKNVLGFLIDDKQPVPNLPGQPEGAAALPISVGELKTVRRLNSLVQTMMGAHDNMAVAVFAKNVVRLPAKGIGTTQFDMTDAQREALVEGGRQAMRAFLAQQSVLEGAFAGGGLDLSAPPESVQLANEVAAEILTP
jgi:predicted acylesterase/phospholipase RssA